MIFVNYISWMVFKKFISEFSLFQFSLSVVSNSLQRHGLQQTKLPCPSLSPGVCSNSCPLSWWCHTIISSSISHFSSCPQSFPASRSFLKNWLFPLCGQSIGASASASILPMNIQGSFLLDWLVWSCLIPLIRGLSKVFSCTTIQNHQFFDAQTSLWSNFYICTWLLGKNHSFDYTDFCGQNDVSAF